MKNLLSGIIILLLLGLAAWQLGRAGLLAAKAWAAPILIEHAWEESLQAGVVKRPWPWADSGPVARLEVPRLQLKRFILGGDNMRNLAFGPVSQTFKNGMVLFGHRDTHFRFLQHLRLHDEVFIQNRIEGSQKWIVAGLEVANSNQIYVPQEEGRGQLVLITCYPFSSLDPDTAQRFIVRLQQA